MTNFSRRKFLRGLFASLAVFSCIPLFRTTQRVTLSVDEEGNATLIGADLIVDEQAKATVM